jgi:EAL domain-containing protein (putative c-di-GMP-specific phosphodiesterase class I)
LSINVSSRLVATGGLVEVLRLYDASRVVFDLIEGGELADLQLVGGIDDLTQAITDLQRLGVRIALDDTVGVDSSFSELVLIPFDILKIDRPLVRDVDKHPDRAVGITALVQLATATGADVVAEGIETADELAALINIDVRYGQGYHFAYPAPLDQQTLPVAS